MLHPVCPHSQVYSTDIIELRTPTAYLFSFDRPVKVCLCLHVRR